MPETNPILQSLYARKSVRVFEEKAIPAGMKQAILEAAAQAPSAGCQQLYTILDITDPALKAALADSFGAKFVDAVAGDITAAMPYRAMTNIINFIQAADIVVPGFAASETLLYSPELKFYSNRVKMDEELNTNVRGLHCLGDSSGWTRGLMMASAMGVLMGRKLAENA